MNVKLPQRPKGIIREEGLSTFVQFGAIAILIVLGVIFFMKMMR